MSQAHFSTISAPKPTSLNFKVRRCKAELVAPAKPTPREVKQLSIIDNQRTLRHLLPVIQFYRYEPDLMRGKHPARVIREALAQSLVFYYPLAGRVREGPAGKLEVDCTGEGILLVEAEADVELVQFGDPPQPPFPCFEEFYYSFDDPKQGIFNNPILFIQVTRLKCGGFVIAVRFNHTVVDGLGIGQFLTAVGEIARGARAPSIIPVWDREIFNAIDSPRMTYESAKNSHEFISQEPDKILRSFFLGPAELQAIRRFVPHHTRPNFTLFEILSACMWRCRTTALQLNPEDQVYMTCIFNLRGKFDVPVGYYGNAVLAPTAVTTAKKLCESPIEYVAKLIKNTKNEVTKDYMHLLTDHVVDRVLPSKNMERWFSISDLRQVGFHAVDYGWGKATYGGMAKLEAPGCAYLMPFKNLKGEDGLLVPLCLPAQNMSIFETELNNMFSYDHASEHEV